MTLHEELKSLLKKDERLVSEDKLLKNKIVELSLKLDKDLIKLLLSNKKIKEHFFEEVEKTLIFDKEKFMKFVDNKEFLPESYTSFKNKIGLTSDRKYLAKNKEVILSWPFKDCILEGGQEQEDEKRKEIFHNEILAPDEIDRLLEPKVFTNFKKLDTKGENKVTEIKSDDNLIIKGNNLLVLHSLQKRYSGRVKLIYIDPPYNTGSDSFGYNDNFNHSTWLTFMKNRLEVAKKLLRDDGVIYIQIDDKEHAYLKVLCDEIFERENFITNIIVKTKTPSGVGQESYIFTITENILVYSKNRNKLESNSYKIFDEILDENSKTANNYNLIVEDYGEEESSYDLETGSGKPIKVVILKNFKFKRNSKKDCTSEWYFKNYENIFRLSPANGGLMKKLTPKLPKEPCYIEYMPSKGKYANQKIKIYFINRDMVVKISESSEKDEKSKIVNKLVNVHNSWTDESLWQGISKEGNVVLKNGKKPELLLQRMIEISSNEKDIILDYHVGSGTTCAVAHKLNRQYIGVEQLDYGENDSVQRIKNVIGKEILKGKLSATIEDYDTSGISKAVNWKGGGSFVYCELKQLNEEFVQKIKKAKDSKELLKIWEEMKNHAFLSYRVDEKLFDENIDEFKHLSTDEQKKLLVKCLDANNLYVNFSEMEDSQYKINKEDKDINKKLYGGL